MSQKTNDNGLSPLSESNRSNSYRDLIIRTATSFIDLPTDLMDKAVDGALADIGAFFEADRTYLFTYDLERELARNTHEWCAPGVEPQIQHLQSLDTRTVPDWVSLHTRGEPLLVPQVQALPQGPVRDILEPQGIQSLLTTPLMDGGKCIGFVGLDAVRNPVQYGEDEMEMLQLFASLLVNMERRKRTTQVLIQVANERQAAYEAVQASEQRYKALFNNSRDALIIVAPPDWRFVTCNAAAVKLFDCPDLDTLLQCGLTDLSPEQQPDGQPSGQAALERLNQAMTDGASFFEWMHLDYHGRDFLCSVLLNRIDWAGEVVIQGTVRYISASKAAERALQQKSAELEETNAQLEHLAHYDTITQLPNRNLLGDRIKVSMRQAVRRKSTLALAYLDLDGFKTINDHFGHDIGDRLLARLGQEMRASLRDGDTLARLGGDEFVAVLVDLTDPAAAEPLMARLLKAAAQPIELDGLHLQVSGSAGVTFYPQAEAIDADQLMRQADQAMYQAKLGGRNQFSLFDTERALALKDHQARLKELHRALREDQLRLLYQPRVNMRTGEVLGVEALVRWQHPTEGLLPPAKFLSLLQDHPLSVELDDWVMGKALQQMTQWHRQGLMLSVSINLSALQLQQADFISKLRRKIEQLDAISRDRIELEIVESSALDDINQASAVIEACSGLGVAVALDDFGTGYSSLTYLKRLPADILKIDNSFVLDMLDSEDDLAIIEGIMGLATAFRRTVVAEGVETLAHGERLLDLGCEQAQGFGIARPMPAESVAAWAETWRPPKSWLNRPVPAKNNRNPL